MFLTSKKKQEAVDKAIAANKEAIAENDKEIKEFLKKRKDTADEKIKVRKSVHIENGTEAEDNVEDHKNQRKCRYFNRGFHCIALS